jgi:aminomethyltransferase
MALQRSPLHGEHIKLDARLIEFGGWEMPIAYSTGTLNEHRRCRDSCVMFDVSHLGSVRVQGDKAYERLQYVFSNSLDRIKPGKAQYSHLLNEKGFVADDVIIWWLEPNLFEIMPNASNTSSVQNALTAGGEELSVIDVTSSRAVIAVQGPTSREVIGRLNIDLAKVPRFHVQQMTVNGIELIVAGTGYTGEDGVEISIPADQAECIWNELHDSGCIPGGLGARDTLRLEAGLPLHGHELGDGISPLEANLKWVVSMDKGDFRGKEALVEKLETGLTRKLYGLVCSGRRPPRHGQEVAYEGVVVGHVTSGNFSPVIERGIAMALLPVGLNVGDHVEVRGRSQNLNAEITALPFYTRSDPMSLV